MVVIYIYLRVLCVSCTEGITQSEVISRVSHSTGCVQNNLAIYCQNWDIFTQLTSQVHEGMKS